MKEKTIDEIHKDHIDDRERRDKVNDLL